MSKSGLVSGITFAITLIVSNLSQAQSLTVDSSNSMAVDCYDRSIEALSAKDARFADIQLCDAAIDEGDISSEDLMATLVNRGVIYATLGQLDRAAEDYNRALAIADDVPEIHLNQGNLEFLAENWDQAISHYNQAEALGLIQAHVLHLNRGMAFENSESFEQAEAEYSAALELVPEWQPALERLQELQGMEAGQPEQTPQELN